MAAPTPSNPPPAIPVGLGTTLGGLGTITLAFVAVLTAVLQGDHSTETVGAFVSAAVVLIATIAGRFAQAYAIYRDAPSPTTVVTVMEPDATVYIPATDVDLSGDAPAAARKPRRRT